MHNFSFLQSFSTNDNIKHWYQHLWRQCLVEGPQGFWDENTKALITMEEGVKNNPKLRDVIYGQPLIFFVWKANILSSVFYISFSDIMPGNVSNKITLFWINWSRLQMQKFGRKCCKNSSLIKWTKEFQSDKMNIVMLQPDRLNRDWRLTFTDNLSLRQNLWSIGSEN